VFLASARQPTIRRNDGTEVGGQNLRRQSTQHLYHDVLLFLSWLGGSNSSSSALVPGKLQQEHSGRGHGIGKRAHLAGDARML